MITYIIIRVKKEYLRGCSSWRCRRMLLPAHMGQTSVRVTYTYVQWRKHTLSFHWAYYWYGKPGWCKTPISSGGLEPLDPLKAVERNSRMCHQHTFVVWALIPQSFWQTVALLTEMVFCSGGSSDSKQQVCRPYTFGCMQAREAVVYLQK